MLYVQLRWSIMSSQPRVNRILSLSSTSQTAKCFFTIGYRILDSLPLKGENINETRNSRQYLECGVVCSKKNINYFNKDINIVRQFIIYTRAEGKTA